MGFIGLLLFISLVALAVDYVSEDPARCSDRLYAEDSCDYGHTL